MRYPLSYLPQPLNILKGGEEEGVEERGVSSSRPCLPSQEIDRDGDEESQASLGCVARPYLKEGKEKEPGWLQLHRCLGTNHVPAPGRQMLRDDAVRPNHFRGV